MNINININIHKNLLQEEVHKEKIPLLKKIKDLPDELIKNIYEYMTGKEKYICNKKYDFLEKMIKGDCNKGYKLFLYIKSILDILTKKQLLIFIKIGTLKNHPFIINKIWYFSIK